MWVTDVARVLKVSAPSKLSPFSTLARECQNQKQALSKVSAPRKDENKKEGRKAERRGKGKREYRKKERGNIGKRKGETVKTERMKKRM